MRNQLIIKSFGSSGGDTLFGQVKSPVGTLHTLIVMRLLLRYFDTPQVSVVSRGGHPHDLVLVNPSRAASLSCRILGCSIRCHEWHPTSIPLALVGLCQPRWWLHVLIAPDALRVLAVTLRGPLCLHSWRSYLNLN